MFGLHDIHGQAVYIHLNLIILLIINLIIHAIIKILTKITAYVHFIVK